MPEGDTIFRSAARLRAALVGKRLASIEVRRDPRGRRGPEPGTEITSVDANGKHLLVTFGDGHVLHTHMQMAGGWHIYPPGARWRRPAHTARVVMRVDDGTTAVCFSAPIVEMRRGDDARDRSTRAARMLDRLGPNLCDADVDMEAVVTRLGQLDGDTDIATALLDQRVAAGVGNVFKSEVCWAVGLYPFTPVGTLDAATRRLVYETAHAQLMRNRESARRTTYGNGLAVYRRRGRGCHRCGSAIVSAPDRNARSTYWCPHCQAGPP